MPQNANKMAGNRIKMPLKRIKTARKRIKKWKIGDYIRQFSIVTGGVLLTLWLTTKIADSAMQKEVREAMQLVALELRDNVNILRSYESLYNEQARIARQVTAAEYSAASLPVDTVLHFAQQLTGGLSRPYRFSTDALEMLKTSGLTSHIADKQQVIDLLRCYNALASFDAAMALFYDLRKEALLAYDRKHPQRSTQRTPEEIVRTFDRMLADESVRNWVCTVPRSFNTTYFPGIEQAIDDTIAELEACYGSAGRKQDEKHDAEQRDGSVR